MLLIPSNGLTGTWQRVANGRIIYKLSLIYSELTVVTEAFQTDHMTLQTLEDQDHIPKRERRCSIYAEYYCLHLLYIFFYNS